MARFSDLSLTVIDQPAFSHVHLCSKPPLDKLSKGTARLEYSLHSSDLSWRHRMHTHLGPERTSTHLPALSPSLEGSRGGIDTIPEDDAFLSPTPSTSSTVRASRSHPTKAPPSTHSLSAAQYGASHFHTDSTSTSASESAASSPTTAPSLTESIHNAETPTTSPDTPASNQFSSTSSPTFTLASRASQFDSRESVALPRPAPADLPRPSTGLKSKRNLKNLAVDTSSATAFGRAISTASLPLNRGETSSMITGAPTPAFLKQPKFLKSKRSALGLTLVTPSTSSAGSANSGDGPNVPPTPSLVRPHALRHFPSSPSLMIRSPNGQPQHVQLGAMESLNSALATGSGVAVGFHPPPATEEEEDDINFDVPQSQEPKVETYPDGPLCIYDPHVYLYYEPSAEQASMFDTIVNVAQEVPNPFKPEQDAASAEADSSASQTPKASTPLHREPEYFHIPWQHNTDIVPDLADLAMLIDDRVKLGKKILIHCQCGVSRSASLIVAYGLYKNPSMTVQEAYDAVKRRSKWINPNMSLIMQLQEFRSQQLKTSAGMPTRGHRMKSPGSISIRSPLDSSASIHSRSRSFADGEDGPKSAPLNSSKHTPSLSDVPTTMAHGSVSPGPSSAPSGFPWPSDGDGDKATDSAYATPLESPEDTRIAQDAQRPVTQPSSPPRIEKRPAPIKLPSTHMSRFQAINANAIAESPRAAQFSMSTARLPPKEDMFGLTSPRADISSSEAPNQYFEPTPKAPVAPPPPPSRPAPLPTVSEHAPQLPPIEPLFSPRSEEFGMIGIKVPSAADETFGLTSPRNDAFASAQPLQGFPFAAPGAAEPQQPLDARPSIAAPPAATSTDTMFSPRSSEFGMKGLATLPDEDTFGLTSPRFGTFNDQLPVHSKRATAISALHPVAVESDSKQQKAGDRAKLRSKLGMSTSSSYDMRSEYILAAKARELRPSLAPQDSFKRDSRTQDDLSDALMSPRATEFTSNPFRDAFSIKEESTAAASVTAPASTTTPRKADPRSPPQKGASPIIRNIFDVFT